MWTARWKLLGCAVVNSAQRWEMNAQAPHLGTQEIPASTCGISVWGADGCNSIEMPPSAEPVIAINPGRCIIARCYVFWQGCASGPAHRLLGGWPGTWPAVLWVLTHRPSALMTARALVSGRCDWLVPSSFLPLLSATRAASALLACTWCARLKYA